MNDYSILIVDDEQRMRSLIKDFLKQKNYTTMEAADGEEALKVYEENKRKKTDDFVSIINMYDYNNDSIECIRI